MHTTLATISSSTAHLDLATLITTLVLGVIGLILWIAGRRILRGSFALIGLAMGGVVGMGAGSAFDLGIPPWAIGVAFGIILACVAAFAYRGVLAAALALILGTAFPLGAWTALDVQRYITEHEAGEEPHLASDDDGSADENSPDPGGITSIDDEPTDPITDWLEGWRNRHSNAPELIGSDPAAAGTQPGSGDEGDLINDAIADELANQGRSRLGDAAEGIGLDREQVDQTITDASDFLQSLWIRFRDVWDQTPPKVQKTLMAACALGVLSGLLLGLSMPGVTAAAVTASGGSLLWLTMTIAMLGQLGAAVGSWIPDRPSAWIAIWTIATLIGLLIQWTISRKKSDTSPKRAGG